MNAAIKSFTVRAGAYPDVVKTLVEESRPGLTCFTELASLVVESFLLFAICECNNGAEAGRIIRKTLGRMSTWLVPEGCVCPAILRKARAALAAGAA